VSLGLEKIFEATTTDVTVPPGVLIPPDESTRMAS
jgi:hypothetical protein